MSMTQTYVRSTRDAYPEDSFEDFACVQRAGCAFVEEKERKIRELEHERKVMLTNYDELRQEVSKLMNMVEEMLTPRNAAVRLFSTRVHDVQGVAEVYIAPSDDVLDFITIVDDYSPQVVDGIVNAQYEMYRVFDELNLDFLILPRAGRNVKDIIPPNAELIRRQ